MFLSKYINYKFIMRRLYSDNKIYNSPVKPSSYIFRILFFSEDENFVEYSENYNITYLL
jgi:hypothetical protein